MASQSSSSNIIQTLKKNNDKLETYMETLKIGHILPIYEKVKTSLTIENEHMIEDFPRRMFEGHQVNKERERYIMMEQELSEAQASLPTAGVMQKRRLQKVVRQLEQRIQEATPRYASLKHMFGNKGLYANTITQYELLKKNGLLAEENPKITDKTKRFRTRCGDQRTLLFDRVLADPGVNEHLLKSILVAIGWAHIGEDDDENEFLESPDNSVRSIVESQEDDTNSTMSREGDLTTGGNFGGGDVDTNDESVDDSDPDDGGFEMYNEWERVLFFLQLCHLLLEETDPSEFIDLLNRDNAQLLINVGVDYAKDYVEKMLHEFPLILELAETPKSLIAQFTQRSGAATKSIDLNNRKMKATRTNLSEGKREYWC